MKKLVVVLGLLLSSMAFATSLRPPLMPPVLKGTIASTGGVSREIKTVAVTDQGALVVTLYSGKVYSKLLSHGAFDEVAAQARQLSDAEIEVRRQRVVCKMMPPPHLHDAQLFVAMIDPGTGEFSSQIRLVQDFYGCWSSVHTNPKSDLHQLAGHKLRSILEVLGFELVN